MCNQIQFRFQGRSRCRRKAVLTPRLSPSALLKANDFWNVYQFNGYFRFPVCICSQFLTFFKMGYPEVLKKNLQKKKTNRKVRQKTTQEKNLTYRNKLKRSNIKVCVHIQRYFFCFYAPISSRTVTVTQFYVPPNIWGFCFTATRTGTA